MAEKPKPKPAAKTHEGERIAKVLSRAGIASRREAERLIEVGEVTVNGKVITSPALNVKPTDKITVSGHPVGDPEPARLWLYYKPEGLVTSASDEKGRDTVFDNLPPELPRVMSVGRLDLNSEGLLLLTNDGELKRRLELPSTGWLRKYRVRVNGNPTDPDLEPLRRGITVDGEKFQPMSVVLDRIQGANAWLTVGIREGRNREIRRAMSAIELTVNRLIRISYGPFRLGDMTPGQVEEIKQKVLREQLGSGATGDDEAKPRVTRNARPKAPGSPSSSATTSSAPSAKPRTSRDTEAKPRTAPPGKPRPTRGAEDRRPASGSADGKSAPSAKATPDARQKPGARLKPGEGLKQLSQAWQKATDPTKATPKPRKPVSRAPVSRPPARPKSGK